MYFTILQYDKLYLYITMYFFNVLLMLIFFINIYDSKKEEISNINFNLFNFKVNVYFLLSLIFGLPPFISFFIKFFLFTSVYNNLKNVYLTYILITFINIIVLYYLFYATRLFFLKKKFNITISKLTLYEYQIFFNFIIFIQFFFYFIQSLIF